MCVRVCVCVNLNCNRLLNIFTGTLKKSNTTAGVVRV